MDKTPLTTEGNQQRKTRELGIEIIRIISMLLIVCQHFLNHGGFIKNPGEHTFFLNLINVLFSPSVNVFVLISGYFSVNSTKLRISKVVTLWTQVLFFSLIMIPISLSLGASISNEYIYQSFLPVITKKYWFFSTYIVLMLITPILAKLINAISKREHLLIVGGIFLTAYLSTRFEIQSVFSLNWGYGISWFIMLFFVGAYFKKYPVKINKLILLAVYISTVLLQMTFKYYLNDTTKFIYKLIYSDTNYHQPLTLIASVCLLLLFLGIENNGGVTHKVLTYISSCTFGVYLFHEAPCFRDVVYSNLFKTQNYWGRPYSALLVIAFAIVVFVAGVGLESLRKLIFYVIKKVRAFYKKASNV